jgi:hypothetical protein
MDFDTPPIDHNAKPVTHWVSLLKAGDEHAAQRLWEEYYLRLVR